MHFGTSAVPVVDADRFAWSENPYLSVACTHIALEDLETFFPNGAEARDGMRQPGCVSSNVANLSYGSKCSRTV